MSGTKVLDENHKQQIDAEFDKTRKLWKERKRWFGEAFGALTENIKKSELAEFQV